MNKKLAFLGTVTLAAGIVAGCGGNDNGADDAAENGGASELSGSITAAGSTALQPLAEEAAYEFMQINPNLSITVQGGGSGTGVNQVADGTVQIGNSDIPSSAKLEDAEERGLVDTQVAGLGFAVVVNESAGVESLTVEEIQKIFSGEFTNWNEVGGEDVAIQVINRPASSGTRVTFEETVMGEVAIDDTIGTNQESNGAVQQAIETTDGAISYLAMSYLVGNDTLQTLAIDGVEPTTENIIAGTYPFWAYQYMITQGEPTGEVLAFIEFIQSEEFAPVAETMGYISMSALK